MIFLFVSNIFLDLLYDTTLRSDPNMTNWCPEAENRCKPFWGDAIAYTNCIDTVARDVCGGHVNTSSSNVSKGNVNYGMRVMGHSSNGVGGGKKKPAAKTKAGPKKNKVMTDKDKEKKKKKKPTKKAKRKP
jgi:hypothetical protein